MLKFKREEVKTPENHPLPMPINVMSYTVLINIYKLLCFSWKANGLFCSHTLMHGYISTMAPIFLNLMVMVMMWHHPPILSGMSLTGPRF